MNLQLPWADYYSLSPYIIVLIGAVIVLLLETFSTSLAYKLASAITRLTLVSGLIAVYFAPASTNPLITPWLRFDKLTDFFNYFFLATGFISTVLAMAFFKDKQHSRGEYYFLLLSCVLGLMLIGASNDFLTLFLGLETLSISLYVLVGYIKKWTLSHESAVKYFFNGSIAAALFLYGIALCYGALGTTNFAELAPKFHALQDPASSLLFFAGIAFVTLGLAFKASIFPFHLWAPDVYAGSPTPLTAFMAVGTKAGAFAALALLFLVALPNFSRTWEIGASVLSALSLIFANFVALRQTQGRRFFAYSGISHAGYLLMPIAAGTPDALPALSYYLIVYAFATLGCFAILAFFDQSSEGALFSDLKGLFQRSPMLALIFALCLLTLAGIPPTAGFFAKFYVLKTAYEAGLYPLVILGLLTAILGAYYYLRIVALLFQKPDTEASLHLWPARGMAFVTGTALIALAFLPAPLINLLEQLR